MSDRAPGRHPFAIESGEFAPLGLVAASPKGKPLPQALTARSKRAPDPSDTGLLWKKETVGRRLLYVTAELSLSGRECADSLYAVQISLLGEG